MPSSPKTIAILVPDVRIGGGGVLAVADFIDQVIRASGRYQAQIISLAISRSDSNSVRLFSPTTWKRGVHITEETWKSRSVLHAGAFLTELEFQRYMPRRSLTDLLNRCDLIQVISGGPAIAHVARNTHKPVCLFLATLTRLERQSALEKAGFARKVYGYTMLPVVSSLEVRALDRVDHVFAETEYTRQAILPYVDPAKVSIDTIGVDTQRFHPLPEEHRGEDFILSVGRFGDARKNVSMLFEAYALLRQWLPDAPRLILAGRNAPPSAAWARARQLGLTEHIVLEENIPLEALIGRYQNAAFFALSSDEEGLGIVLLEAMACATPVVSTRCGGPDSVVSEEVGWLTPVGDAAALAERMRWMLDNPEQRRRMGRAGRALVEHRFSNEVVGQKYLEVYDRLLGDRHRP